MWYEESKPLVESGELAILGVIQEQHADRAQLYKQWKKFEFPILQDATTQLNLSAVPIPVLIDEHGVVRNNRPRPGDLKSFVERSFDPPQNSADDNHRENPSAFVAAMNAGNLALQSREEKQISGAIQSFSEAVKLEPKNGKAHFSLGVAYRARFDSSLAVEKDFEYAAKFWGQALAINPNQYIWRRRIEQYGPRQIKPYPFYDWVDNAIADIKARGDQPIEISVPLTGAEIAQPAKFLRTTESDKNPDPEAKIFVDEKATVKIAATTVPTAVEAGKNVRVHLLFDLKQGKWNEEAPPLKIWINESSNGIPETRLIEHQPTNILSNNQKQVDFEFVTAADTSNCQISGYALYHFCDDDGVCYYYRKDFTFPIKLTK